MTRRSILASVALLCAFTVPAFTQTTTRSQITDLGAADPAATTHFTVYFPLTHQDKLEQLVNDQADSSSPSYHQWLTPTQFKAQFGPNPGDVNRVTRRLEQAGFTVTAQHTQSIEVTGPVAAVETLFTTRLDQVRMHNGNVRFSAAHHPLSLPAELAAAGVTIPDFYPELSAHVHSAVVNGSVAAAGAQLAPTQNASPSERLSTSYLLYYPNDLNEAYSFPSFTTQAKTVFGPKKQQITGAGARIGIVINSVISPADLNASFNSEVYIGPYIDIQDYSTATNVPVPSVTIRPVNGGSGPFNPNSGSAPEAALDTQMSLGTAPGAQETLYNMPDLSWSSIAAAYAAIDEDNSVDVVSTSIGGCELYFTAAYNGGRDFTSIPRQIHQILLQGNAQGITFVVSSGDNGAVPCLSAAFINNPTNGTSYVKGVEYPASDPAVTAVGGTNLVTVPAPTANDATYYQENADFDPRVPAEFRLGPNDIVTVNNNTWGSGGGYSVIFPKPAFQLMTSTGGSGRAVPDASLMMGGCPGDADFSAGACNGYRSSDIVWIAGNPFLLIGTSASSPELAGALALDVQMNGRQGNVNPLIYHLGFVQNAAGGVNAPAPLQFFHRNIEGNNNGYTVQPGQPYSAVLGNGTLNVKNFLQLQNAAPAGTPGTPTNP